MNDMKSIGWKWYGYLLSLYGIDSVDNRTTSSGF